LINKKIENIYGKIYNDIIYKTKLIIKTNKIIIIIKIIYYTLNKINFFVNNSKIINILMKIKIKININNNDFIKF
jgi:hypothetical protein